MRADRTRRLATIEGRLRPHRWTDYAHLPFSEWPDAALDDAIMEMAPAERRATMLEAGWRPSEIDAYEAEQKGRVP